ncbi:ABC transporter ATP-binding protein [Chitinimonas taiwanensis]|uniref:ABC transporter ATP-binding protein n=1 Tax=Chitinimonas taiwanensis TaxID=240412 RepID=UPI0035AFC046
MSDSKAIELIQVNKNYSNWRGQKKQALSDVSLSVGKGEAFGFIGPNGAGKSTTIKILTGGIRPDSGEVKIWGKPVGDPKVRQNLGYVPENASLQDFLTPLEVLMMGVHLHGVRVDNPEAHCMHWLERLSIAHVARKTIRSFSKGMLQRTAIAHAMACQPELLIFDEPLSGLDPIGRRDIVDLLVEFRRNGGTIFFSSHVLFDVERLADRFGLIHMGKLLTVQSPNEIIGDKDVMVVRSIGATVVSDMAEESAGRWYGEVSASALWVKLEQLRDAGHQVLEVKPSLSLEQAFLRYVNAKP